MEEERYLTLDEKLRFVRIARSYHLTLIMGWSLAFLLSFLQWNLYPLAAFIIIIVLYNAYIMIRYEVLLLRIYKFIDIADVFLGLYTDSTADQPKKKLTRILGVVFFLLGLLAIALFKLLTIGF